MNNYRSNLAHVLSAAIILAFAVVAGISVEAIFGVFLRAYGFPALPPDAFGVTTALVSLLVVVTAMIDATSACSSEDRG